MPTLIIDGKEITVKPGATIMEAAKLLGIYIPHFCYHPKLSIAGNCRMCLVEVEKNWKPVVACAMPVNEGMVVHTESAVAREARRGVMEFLLINHPLDCPVCDQAGECSLQDLAMKYGPDRTRFAESKRVVGDRELGPIIETVMNRCIHCTRCIRFSQEISGVEEMGAIARGDHMLVGTAVDLSISSELSGNMVELCPVGALNARPFHFQARGWELKQSQGICNQCPVGCHVQREHLDNRVKRNSSSACDEINEVWLCDKGRFSNDGYGVGRLDYPMEKRNGLSSPTPVSWAHALDRAAEILKGVKPEEVAGLAGEWQSAEDYFAFQDFLRRVVGTPHIDHRLRQRDFSGDREPLTRADLLLNTPLAKMAEADAILLIGMDPRYETPLLNMRLRKAALAGAKVVAVYPRALAGNIPGLRTEVVKPGHEARFLQEVLTMLRDGGDSTPAGQIARVLKQAARPLVLLGEYAANHPEAESLRRLAVALLEQCGKLGGEWNGFNRLGYRGNGAAAQDMGVVPHRGPGYARLKQSGLGAQEILQAAAAGSIKVLVLMGVDPILDGVDGMLARQALEKVKLIYIGAYRNAVAESAEVAMPGALFSEKSAIFTNAEGRAMANHKAVAATGEAKEEWRIFRALSDRFPVSLSYNTQEALRKAIAGADHRYNMEGQGDDDLPAACDHSPVSMGLSLQPGVAVGIMGDEEGIILVAEPSFYRDDPMAARSAVMAKLDDPNALRISQQDGDALSIGDGEKIRLIQSDRRMEMVAVIDGLVPPGVVMGRYSHSQAPIQDLLDWQKGFPKVSLVKL